jgi:8-oxo-dGTP diphosphatase
LSQVLHVAVGVIENPKGEILIAKRPDHIHQGGLWEFPGGKVESGESVVQALGRELEEELAIKVNAAEPLIKIQHQYPGQEVLLDVWRVRSYSGQARGREGQQIKWVFGDELTGFDFPAANKPIISAALLPEFYGILEGESEEVVLKRLQLMLAQGVRLIQLRLKTLHVPVSEKLLAKIQSICKSNQVCLIINSAFQTKTGVIADGIHLTSTDLFKFSVRPSNCRWLAASCHNITELKQAEAIGADFVVVAPVSATQSHPETLPLGWEAFLALLKQVNLPVYALGGMKCSNLRLVQQAGGQGIAGISTFVNDCL